MTGSSFWLAPEALEHQAIPFDDYAAQALSAKDYLAAHPFDDTGDHPAYRFAAERARELRSSLISLRVAGVIVNQHEERTVGGAQWLDALREAAEGRGLRIIGQPIPKRVVIADATEAARGLDEWGSAEATALGAIYAEHLTEIEGAHS